MEEEGIQEKEENDLNYGEDKELWYEKQKNKKEETEMSRLYKKERENIETQNQKNDEAMKSYRNEKQERKEMKKNKKAEEARRKFIIVNKDGGDKSYQCSVCTEERKFESLQEAKNHLESHDVSTRQRSFRCRGCEERFTTKEDLEKHMYDAKYGGTKTYHCRSCNRQFNSEEELVEHMKRNHQSFVMKREHTCDECGKRFQSYSNLMKHIKMHKKLGKWVCRICGTKGLLNYKKYKKHMMEHEKGIFNCMICRRSFKKQKQLSMHVRTHTAMEINRASQNGIGKGIQKKENDRSMEREYERVKEKQMRKMDELHKKLQEVLKERNEKHESIQKDQNVLKDQISKVTEELEMEKQKNRNPQTLKLKAEVAAREYEIRRMRERVAEMYRESMKIQEHNNNIQDLNAKMKYSYDVVRYENNKLREINKEMADRLESRMNEIRLLYKEIREREQGKARLEATGSRKGVAEEGNLGRIRRYDGDFAEASRQTEREAQNRRSIRNQSREEVQKDKKQYGFRNNVGKQNHLEKERETKKEESQSPEFKLNNSNFFATEDEDKEKEWMEMRLTKKQKQKMSKVSQKNGKYIYNYSQYHEVDRRMVYSSQEIPCLFHKRQGKSAAECVLSKMHCLAHSKDELLEYRTGRCPICKG